MVGVRAEKRASLEDMKAYTAEQIRTAEAPLIAAGVPLMQRAAHALAEVISRELTATGVRDRILILAGPGSNGGDALFAGAELAARGHGVDILPVSSRIHEPGFQAAQEAGAQVLADLGSAALDIVAAATASSIGTALVAAKVPGAQDLLPAAFIIIAVTVTFYGLTAVPIVKALGLTAAPEGEQPGAEQGPAESPTASAPAP